MGQNKLHKAGQKLPGGKAVVPKGTQQGATAKPQRGQHEGKNRVVNHGRNK